MEPGTLEELSKKKVIMKELFAELERCLKRGEVVNVRLPNRKGGGSCLHLGVASGSVLLVQLLINAGALLDARDVRGQTPLHWAMATKECPTAIIRLLCKTDRKLFLKAEANKNAPLHLMAMRGSFPIINFSVSFFSEEEIRKFINLPGRGGRTALHFACRRSLIEMMGVLINFGADPWATCNGGLTSLHHVVAVSDCPPRKEMVRAVKVIVQFCPHLTYVRDKRGRTPADVAKQYGNLTTEVAEELRIQKKCSVADCKTSSVGRVSSKDEFGEPGLRCGPHGG